MTYEIETVRNTQRGRRVDEITDRILRSQWDAEAEREIADAYGVPLAQVRGEAEVVNYVLDIVAERRPAIVQHLARQANTIMDLAAHAHAKYRRKKPNASVAALGVALRAVEVQHKVLGLGKQAKEAEQYEQREARAALREALREPEAWLSEMLSELGWVRLESK